MRKKLLFVIAIVICSLPVLAQNCKDYFYLQNGKTIEMSVYNKKGKPSGHQVYKVSDVKNHGGTLTATLHTEMFDKKGKSVAKGSSEIECNGGVIMINMKMFLPQQQQKQFSQADAKAKNVYIEYPANMSVGDHLKDGNFDMDVETGGMKQSVSMVIDNRTVEGKESVTTPAGTWKCFKISYTTKMNIKTMGIGVPMKVESTEWYAPGFGVVKTESKYGKTEITSIK